jgi:hypothetical protein
MFFYEKNENLFFCEIKLYHSYREAVNSNVGGLAACAMCDIISSREYLHDLTSSEWGNSIEKIKTFFWLICHNVC